MASPTPQPTQTQPDSQGVRLTPVRGGWRLSATGQATARVIAAYASALAAAKALARDAHAALHLCRRGGAIYATWELRGGGGSELAIHVLPSPSGWSLRTMDGDPGRKFATKREAVAAAREAAEARGCDLVIHRRDTR